MKSGDDSTPISRQNQFEDGLLRFINTELLVGSDLAIDADSALFADGVIDSLKILYLLAFIESAIDRTIPDEEIVMKHFRSVRTIAERFTRSHRDDENWSH